MAISSGNYKDIEEEIAYLMLELDYTAKHLILGRKKYTELKKKYRGIWQSVSMGVINDGSTTEKYDGMQIVISDSDENFIGVI